MGVCCIVFDIDGMLFEFFFGKKIMLEFLFSHFMFSLRFMLFPTVFRKNKFSGKMPLHLLVKWEVVSSNSR